MITGGMPILPRNHLKSKIVPGRIIDAVLVHHHVRHIAMMDVAVEVVGVQQVRLALLAQQVQREQQALPVLLVQQAQVLLAQREQQALPALLEQQAQQVQLELALVLVTMENVLQMVVWKQSVIIVQAAGNLSTKTVFLPNLLKDVSILEIIRLT